MEQSDEIGRLAEIVAQYQKSELKVSGYESMIGSLQSEIKDKDEQIIKVESQLSLQRNNQDNLK